jgi:hypothetical protein
MLHISDRAGTSLIAIPLPLLSKLTWAPWVSGSPVLRETPLVGLEPVDNFPLQPN